MNRPLDYIACFILILVTIIFIINIIALAFKSPYLVATIVFIFSFGWALVRLMK